MTLPITVVKPKIKSKKPMRNYGYEHDEHEHKRECERKGDSDQHVPLRRVEMLNMHGNGNRTSYVEPFRIGMKNSKRNTMVLDLCAMSSLAFH